MLRESGQYDDMYLLLLKKLLYCSQANIILLKKAPFFGLSKDGCAVAIGYWHICNKLRQLKTWVSFGVGGTSVVTPLGYGDGVLISNIINSLLTIA